MTELTYSQLCSIALGVLDVRHTPEGYRFDRFTPTQAAAFYRKAAGLGIKCTTSAGARLDFYTDADFLRFDYAQMVSTSDRRFSYFDVYCNDSLLLHYGSSDASIPSDGTWQVSLPAGENRVQIYFPTLASFALKALFLSEGASLRPHCPQRHILLHGDSITQGYDARFPSQTYAARLSRYYDAEIFNQAIGAACFNPEVIERVTENDPDFILIAYGTNDWQMKNSEEFRADAQAFFHKIVETYPGVPTFQILPIWRTDLDEVSPNAGDFMECRQRLAKWACTEGITVLDNYELVPYDTDLFSDGYLHPNDEGFAFYARNLCRMLDPLLKK